MTKEEMYRKKCRGTVGKRYKIDGEEEGVVHKDLLEISKNKGNKKDDWQPSPAKKGVAGTR